MSMSVYIAHKHKTSNALYTSAGNTNLFKMLFECISATSKITQVVQQESPHWRASRRESSLAGAQPATWNDSRRLADRSYITIYMASSHPPNPLQWFSMDPTGECFLPHRPSLCRTVPQFQKSGYTVVSETWTGRQANSWREDGTAAGLNHYSHQSINQCVTLRRASERSDPHVLKGRSRQLLQLRLPGGMARVTYAHVRATCVSISAEIRASTHFAGDFQRSASKSNILSQLPCSLINWLPRKSE